MSEWHRTKHKYRERGRKKEGKDISVPSEYALSTENVTLVMGNKPGESESRKQIKAIQESGVRSYLAWEG
jgi:hypothetical protein